MGILVKNIAKAETNICTNVFAAEPKNNSEKAESIFLKKEKPSYLNENTVSIAATIILGIASICFAPRLLKLLKNNKLCSNIKKGFKVKTPTAPASLTSQSKLTLSDKMDIIKEKFNLTPEELKNPVLRHNIEHLYDSIVNIKSKHFIEYLMKRKLTFSPEGIAQLDKLGLHWCQKQRAILKNYPVEVIEHAGKAEKSLSPAQVLSPRTNSGTDTNYGKEIMAWYQATFSNSGEVNNALRHSQTLSKKAKEVISFFDSHQRPLGESTTLIRGTDFLKDIKPGSIITDKGYMSCATKQGFIENIDDFSGPFVKHKNFLIIKTPANQKVIVPSDWKRFDSMGERILPRGTSLKVVEVHPLTDYGNNMGQNILENRQAIICEIVQ